MRGRPVPADVRRRRELVARWRAVAPAWLVADDPGVRREFGAAAQFAEDRRGRMWGGRT